MLSLCVPLHLSLERCKLQQLLGERCRGPFILVLNIISPKLSRWLKANAYKSETGKKKVLERGSPAQAWILLNSVKKSRKITDSFF